MGKRAVEKSSVSRRHKKKKKRGSSSSGSSSSSDCSLSSIDEETKRKLKKKIKKLKKKKKLKKEKKLLKKLLSAKLKDEILRNRVCSANPEAPSTAASSQVDDDLAEKSKSLAPMTKEEWEKQQNTLKRVYDEETGRMRLVRGTGEIVEECVSRDRHLAINKQATKGDGEFFQRKLLQQIK